MLEYFGYVATNYPIGNMSPLERERQEKLLSDEKRKQAGVTFPSASKQEHLLIVRLNLQSSVEKNVSKAQNGLRTLCYLLERIDSGIVKIEELQKDGSIEPFPISRYNFSSTIGFGEGFFRKLNIKKNRPARIYEMPDNTSLKDCQPYILTQTDLLIQLGSSKQYVNRLVLQNDSLQADQSIKGRVQSLSYKDLQSRSNLKNGRDCNSSFSQLECD